MKVVEEVSGPMTIRPQSAMTTSVIQALAWVGLLAWPWIPGGVGLPQDGVKACRSVP